jgi:alpha 1,2-mannosyltransferase
MNPESFYRGVLAASSERFPPYPEGRYRGRGIVLCAGGLVHLANAYVCMKFLREFTSLPIELFFAGGAEMPPEVRELLRRDFAPITLTDITNPELRAVYPFLPVDHFRGVQIKPYALLQASFEEIFYIDADNIPLQSPEPLFASEPYLRTGALFWPDLASTKSTTEELFRTFGVTAEALRRGVEFESGQIVLDKRRCWKALLTVCLANSDVSRFRDFCFGRTMGDKDTFRLAFEFARQPYHLVSHPSLRIGNLFFIYRVPLTGGVTIKIQHGLGSFYATGMLQHDLAGNPLFAHKTVCEWDVDLDFRNLCYIEEGDGQTRPLAWLADCESRGCGHLNEFREQYLKHFGRSRRRKLQGLAARWIIRILDAVQSRQAGRSA